MCVPLPATMGAAKSKRCASRSARSARIGLDTVLATSRSKPCAASLRANRSTAQLPFFFAKCTLSAADCAASLRRAAAVCQSSAKRSCRVLGCAGESILGTLCVFVLAQGRCQQTGSEMRALIQKGLTDPKESRGSGTKKNSPKAPNKTISRDPVSGPDSGPSYDDPKTKQGPLLVPIFGPVFLGNCRGGVPSNQRHRAPRPELGGRYTSHSRRAHVSLALPEAGACNLSRTRPTKPEPTN